MGSISIGIALDHGNDAGRSERRTFSDIAPGMAIPLPIGIGSLRVRIRSLPVYSGNYRVQTNNLLSGPVRMMAPQIAQDSESGVLDVTLPGLWAYDELSDAPVLTYRWQRNGTDILGATGAQYTPGSEDAGQTLQVIETATDAGGLRSQISNTVVIAALPDPFAVSLAADGTLQITGNDGRNFTLDDPNDLYDGAYSVDPAALNVGPVGLVAPQLSALTVAEAGATLAITPALFAYDPARGAVTLSYTTNGTNVVDATDPAAPTLLIDVADAETALTVTATATQAGVPVGQISNTVVIAALPDPFAVSLAADGTLQITGNDGRNFTLDDSSDRYDGTYNIAAGNLDTGPAALVAPVLSGTAEIGQRLAIIPPLFAYDPDLGNMSVSYTTNGMNAVDITDPEAPTLLVDAADVGATLTVTATAAQGVNTTDSVSNGVMISTPATSPVLITNASMAQNPNTNTATPSVTMDLSSLQAGDKFYLFYGVSATPAQMISIQVDGGTGITPIAQVNGGGGGRGYLFEYTMPGVGSATATVQINLTTNRSDHSVVAWGVRGATRDDESLAHMVNNVGSNTVTVTPATTNNLVVAAMTGRTAALGSHSWTGATEFALSNTRANGNTAGQIANVPAEAYDITFTPDPAVVGTTSNDWAIVAVAYSGA